MAVIGKMYMCLLYCAHLWTLLREAVVKGAHFCVLGAFNVCQNSSVCAFVCEESSGGSM